MPDRHYLWSLGNLSLELDGPDTSRVSEYAYQAPGIGAPPFAIVTGRTSIGLIRNVMQDALGSEIGLVSGTNVAQRREFDRWGNLSLQTGVVADTNRLRWKSLLWEGDSTQLYYAANRWYDPATGRFVSQDPAGLDAAGNQHNFGEDDQVTGQDPTGTHNIGIAIIPAPDCVGFGVPCLPGGILTKIPAFENQDQSGGFVSPCSDLRKEIDKANHDYDIRSLKYLLYSLIGQHDTEHYERLQNLRNELVRKQRQYERQCKGTDDDDNWPGAKYAQQNIDEFEQLPNPAIKRTHGYRPRPQDSAANPRRVPFVLPFPMPGRIPVEFPIEVPIVF